jgi:hypothetical protein
MKRSIILLFCIFIFSCSKNKKTQTKYIKHNIEFLNWNLNIPENYISVSFEEYKNIVSESFNDSIALNKKLLSVEILEKKITTPYVFFIDKNNIENTLIINSMLNPIPNKYFKDEIAVELHSDFRKKGGTQGYIYKPIENKLINDWLIKIKGEKDFTELNRKIYNTIYFSNNFGAIVTSTNKELDFEKEMTE